MFSGMKADLGRSFSANPLFQVQHSFTAGSSQAAPWSFLSLYATDNVSFSPAIGLFATLLTVDFLARQFR
jgi:hypothetical protein